MKITARTTAGEVMAEYPELTDFLVTLKVSGCNDGCFSDLLWSIEQIAEERDLDVRVLVHDLNRRIH